MPLLTQTFLMDFESNMRALTEDEYARFSDPSNTWWDLVAKRRPSATKRELLAWFLSTAQLFDQGQGGTFRFQDPVMLETEFTNKTSGAALEVRRQQIEDIDGNGVDGGEAIRAASKWSRDMGAMFAYWPQLKIVDLVKNGETGTGYDGVPFFSASHPVDGLASSTTYSNLLTGTSYSIDASVSADTAMQNLAKVYKAIRSIKAPNGNLVRMLRPAAILCGPALFPRVSQIVDAKFLAMAASSGGGSADFSGYAARLGYGRVVEMPEMVESEWDTSYLVAVEQVGSTELGGLVYIDREAYSVRYYTGRGGGLGTDAWLDRADMLEWHASGRNVAGYGHPYLLIKVKPV